MSKNISSSCSSGSSIVVVGGALKSSQVHFQQEAGLRLFMQHSFTTFRERMEDRIGWRRSLHTTISTTTTT